MKFDQEKAEIIMVTSPIRLMLGGRARLVRLAISHQPAIRGRID